MKKMDKLFCVLPIISAAYNLFLNIKFLITFDIPVVFGTDFSLFTVDIAFSYFISFILIAGTIIYFVGFLRKKPTKIGKNLLLTYFRIGGIYIFVHILCGDSWWLIVKVIGFVLSSLYFEKIFDSNINKFIKKRFNLMENIINNKIYFIATILISGLQIKSPVIWLLPHFYCCYEVDDKKPKRMDIIQENDIRSEKMEDKECIYDIEGVRGRKIEVYKDKAVISTRAGLGSFITGNATDGEKTIYYRDVIGVQFKKSGITLGYIQLETASSSMNNKNSNFFNENSFTFDVSKVSNEKMEEVANYIKKQVEAYKNFGNMQVNNFSAADEIKKYKELLDMGVITQEEFERKKVELLK